MEQENRLEIKTNKILPTQQINIIKYNIEW